MLGRKGVGQRTQAEEMGPDHFSGNGPTTIGDISPDPVADQRSRAIFPAPDPAVGAMDGEGDGFNVNILSPEQGSREHNYKEKGISIHT